jgi:hypothetical protein
MQYKPMIYHVIYGNSIVLEIIKMAYFLHDESYKGSLVFFKNTPRHSSPELGKKQDKIDTFYSMHIFSNPIQEKGKMRPKEFDFELKSPK